MFSLKCYCTVSAQIHVCNQIHLKFWHHFCTIWYHRIMHECTKHFWYCQLTSFLFAPHENQGKYDEFPRHGFYHHCLSNLEEKGKILNIMNSFWSSFLSKSTKTKYVACLIKIFHFKKFPGRHLKEQASFFGWKKVVIKILDIMSKTFYKTLMNLKTFWWKSFL